MFDQTGKAQLIDRLLIVDDEEALVELYSQIGEAQGYTVRATDDAETVWQIVEQWTPTVIILDLRMPSTDGIEILRGLSDRRVTARILISSGSDAALLEMAQRIGRGRGLSVVGALPKPLHPARLREILVGLKAAAEPVTANSLRNGIDRDELNLVYQPKFDLRDGRLVGVEALVRWQHPTSGSILPGKFVALAEASGIIDNLTELVIEKALAQVAAWRSGGFHVPVAINVSPTNLRALDFPDRLSTACNAFRIAPSSIILELTETAAHDDHNTLMDILTRLRLRDLNLSIDDFGTGHSSLFKLHTLPFSELKLDRSFIAEARTSSRALTIIKSTIQLAHALRMVVVAEGIEDAETAAMLYELGCDIGQGFHFSKPVPGDAITKLLQRRSPQARSVEGLVDAVNA